MWKEPVERRGKKAQKRSEVERRCGGHFVARRPVHGDWWECDDESETVQQRSRRERGGRDSGSNTTKDAEFCADSSDWRRNHYTEGSSAGGREVAETT